MRDVMGGHVASTEKVRNTYKILAEKREGEQTTLETKNRWG